MNSVVSMCSMPRFPTALGLSLGLLGLLATPGVRAAPASKSPAPMQAVKSAAAKTPADKARAAAEKSRRSAQTRNGPVELYAVNGKEILMLRLRDEKGRPLRGIQKRFAHFLRCHHTTVQHP